jgi:hypothetical protein
VEQIKETPLYFEADALCIGNFLNSEEQKLFQLRMFDGDAWTGLNKIHQVLENTLSMTDRLSKCHYTILTLEHLLCSESYVELLILNLVLNPPQFPCTGNSQPLTAGSAIADSTFLSCE